MKRVIFLFQTLLKISILFLLAFVWARYFIHSFWISAAISLAVALLLSLLTRSYSQKKSTASSLKLKEQTAAENTFLSLATSKNAMGFFYDLAKAVCPSVEKKKAYVVLMRAEKVKIVLYPVLKFADLTQDDLAKVLSDVEKEKAQKIVIFSGGYQGNVGAFCQNFDEKIVLLDKYASYAFYKEYNVFPPISAQYKTSGKAAFRDTIKLIFNKDKAKGYLTCALFLFLSSFIVRASLYYNIFASILFVLALIAYSSPFSNENLKEEIL